MAKKAAKRARLASDPQMIDDNDKYYEQDSGIQVVLKEDGFSYGDLCNVIPWSMLIASVRRYNDVQRQKCQAKRASK